MLAKLCLVSLVGLGQERGTCFPPSGSLPLLYIGVGSWTQEFFSWFLLPSHLCPKSKQLLLLLFLPKQQMSVGFMEVRRMISCPSLYADRFCFNPCPADPGGRRVYCPIPSGLKLFCFNKEGSDDMGGCLRLTPTAARQITQTYTTKVGLSLVSCPAPNLSYEHPLNTCGEDLAGEHKLPWSSALLFSRETESVYTYFEKLTIWHPRATFPALFVGHKCFSCPFCPEWHRFLLHIYTWRRGKKYIYLSKYLREINIYFKELALKIMEAGKSKICRVVWEVGEPRKSQCYNSGLKAVCWQNFSGDLSLFLLKSSTDWKRPTHMLEGNLFYTKPTDLNVIFI